MADIERISADLQPRQTLELFVSQAKAASPESEADVLGVLRTEVLIALASLIAVEGRFITPLGDPQAMVELEIIRQRRGIGGKVTREITGEASWSGGESQKIDLASRRTGFLGVKLLGSVSLEVQEIIGGSLNSSYALTDKDSYMPHLVSQEAVDRYNEIGGEPLVEFNFGSMETGHVSARKAAVDRPEVLQGFLQTTAEVTGHLLSLTG